MIHSYNKIFAAQHEEAHFVQCINHCEGLTFNWRVTRFGRVVESASNQGDFPASIAAEGRSAGQSQCFWNSQKPMPSFDQSVARQVGFDLSKICTPCLISLTITFLDSSKSWFSSSVHENLEPDLSALRKGNMRSAAAKAYETWFMRLNQERTSVILLGRGKLRIASRYF